jgi:hypothetical protein
MAAPVLVPAKALGLADDVAPSNRIAADGITKEGTAAKDAIAFCDRIQYVGIAVREPEHHVWGCTPVKDDDGKYHLFGARFGNPFKTASPATGNEELIEDGTAFIWNGKVCLLTTDNHGNVLRGGGAFWQSDDGLKFGPPALGYYHFDKYVSHEQYPRTHGVKGRRIKSYSKIVRPQILMEDGRPAWLYAPSGSCQKGREYSDCHVFRILTDEELKSAANMQTKTK